MNWHSVLLIIIIIINKEKKSYVCVSGVNVYVEKKSFSKGRSQDEDSVVCW